MQQNIEIKLVTVETKPTAKGSYQQAEVVYKNLDKGSTETKKLMSFTNKPVFETASSAKAGEVFQVELTKGEKFWEWTSMVKGTNATEAVSGTSLPAGKGFASPKSTYETAEERAARQVLIVRQSSLSSAIATLSPAIDGLTPSNVKELAQEYVDWVFQKESKDLRDFSTLEDDPIPY